MITPNSPTAYVEGLFVAPDKDDFYSYPLPDSYFTLDGVFDNPRHSGRTTLADIRAPAYHKKQDTVLNRQQLTVVGGEDLDVIGDELGIDAAVALDSLARRLEKLPRKFIDIRLSQVRYLEDLQHKPERTVRYFLAQCLGAQVLVNGFKGTELAAEFKDLPVLDMGSYDQKTRKFSGPAVMLTRPNPPCIVSGKKIEDNYLGASDKLASCFVKVAMGRRGFTAMVTKEGRIEQGQQVQFVPFGQR